MQPARDPPGLECEAPGLDAPPASRCAIFTGSLARAIALAISTPSQPSSIAIAASEAVPTPASQITGTPACSTMIARLYGIADPHAAADRRARAASPPRSRPPRAGGPGSGRRSCRAAPRIPRPTSVSAASSSSVGVREERAVVADHLELDPVGLERLARHARRQHGVVRRVAAGGVRQQEQPELVEHLDHRARARPRRRAAARRSTISAPDAAIASLHHVEAAEPAGADDQARAPGAAAISRSSASISSSTLDRRQQLDPLAVRELRRAPTRCAARPPRRRPPPRRGRPSRPAPSSRTSSATVSAVRQLAVASPFTTILIARPSARRAGREAPRRERRERRRQLRRRRAARRRRRPVSGASRMPLRQCPVAQTRPVERALARRSARCRAPRAADPPRPRPARARRCPGSAS